MCPVIGAEVYGVPCGSDPVDGGECCVLHTCEHPDCLEMATEYTVPENYGDMRHQWCLRHYVSEAGRIFVRYTHIE